MISHTCQYIYEDTKESDYSLFRSLLEHLSGEADTQKIGLLMPNGNYVTKILQRSVTVHLAVMDLV